MKKALPYFPGPLALTMLIFLAACEGPAGPAGPEGRNGTDTVPPVDTALAVAAALEAKTGGGGEPWTVKPLGVDLSDDYAVRDLLHGIASGIEEGEIALNLSGCTGWGMGYNAGLSLRDKARFVSIIFPASLTHIIDGISKHGAFTGFSGLKKISAPGLVYVGAYAFAGEDSVTNPNTALAELELPALEAVGQYAFAYCLGLTSLSLPEARSIGAYAFYGAQYLASITLPLAEEIGANAFAGLNNVYSNRVLTEVDLPEVLSIGMGAFQGCPAIACINLPKAVTLGMHAFAPITSTNTSSDANSVLTSLYLPEAVDIGSYAFQYHAVLETINLPAAEIIDTNAFKGCQAVSTLTLPNVVEIRDSAFDCSTRYGGVPNTALTSLELDITSIGASAFANCTALETVNLPYATTIGASAFDHCAALETVRLPELLNIGRTAFQYCTSLEDLYLGILAPVLPTSTDATNGIFLQTGSAGTITIHVPNGYDNNYTSWGAAAAGDTPVYYGTNHKAVTVTTY
jgi:hypothetical protein